MAVPPAITGPGRTIRGNKIIVKKGSGTIFGCRLIQRSRNIMKIKWSLDINTGAIERSEAARARRLAGATVVGPVHG